MVILTLAFAKKANALHTTSFTTSSGFFVFMWSKESLKTKGKQQNIDLNKYVKTHLSPFFQNKPYLLKLKK